MKELDKNIIFRKLIHSLGAFILLIVKLYGLLTAQILILTLAVIYVVAEYLRLSGKTLQPFTWIVKKASIDNEQKSIVSTPLWYATGVFLTLTLFPFTNAMIGILTLSIGDPVASLVGLSLSKKTPNPINPKKSIEGTLIGLLASIIVCISFIDPYQVLIGCSAGMFIEMLPINLNDNLGIPLTASLVSWWFKIFY